jgi:hypothetical protein
MHPTQDLFLEGFSYVLQIDMHFICTSMWTKFYSCEKWALHAQALAPQWKTPSPEARQAPWPFIMVEGRKLHPLR